MIGFAVFFTARQQLGSANDLLQIVISTIFLTYSGSRLARPTRR